MTEQAITPAEQLSFKNFLFKDKRNRAILILAALAILIQFSVFKYFYPFASYIHGDSFSYLNAAFYNLDINTYLVGYSRFLRIFSVFSSSDLVLTAFQYLFIQASALFLIFTIFYYHNLGKITKSILLSFMVFNPLFLYLANLISSDCLFVSLSLIWFTLLLWLLIKPSNKVIMWHALVLFVAFTVRYNALIYPIISSVAFLISRLPMNKKIVGIGTGFLLCGLFVINTAYQYKKLTGIWQYSPFSGWQFANNAMYSYRYVDRLERKPVNAKFRELDKMIREYFDSTRDTKRFPTEAIMASTFYMWSPGLPLMTYRNKLMKKDTVSSELKRWALMGPFFKSYGLHIIKKYPIHFVRYFVWPNANKYYAPPVEFLESYNSGQDSVGTIAQTWFKYKSRKVIERTGNHEIKTLNFYPIMSGIINVVMLLSLISFGLLQGFKKNNPLRRLVLLGAAVWLLNAGFTIGASSAALRFQAFPIILTTTFSLILLEWLCKMAFGKIETGDIPIYEPLKDQLSAGTSVIGAIRNMD